MITQNIAFIGRQRAGKDFSVAKLKSQMKQNEDMVLVRFAEPLKTLSNIVFGEFGKDEDIKDQFFDISYQKMLGEILVEGKYPFQPVIYELEKLLVEFYNQLFSKEAITSFLNNETKVLKVNLLELEQLEPLKNLYPLETHKLLSTYFNNEEPVSLKVFFQQGNVVLGDDTRQALKVLMLYAHYLATHVKSDGIYTSPRIFQQVMGTDIFRTFVHPDFWALIGYRRAENKALQLSYTNDDIDKVFIISPDVRFPNELPPSYENKSYKNLPSELNYIFRQSRENFLPMSFEEIKLLHPSEVFQELLRNYILSYVEDNFPTIFTENKLSFSFELKFNLKDFYCKYRKEFEYFNIPMPTEHGNYKLIARVNHENN